jgi:hypothetical protein
VVGWPPFSLWTGGFCSISSADDGTVMTERKRNISKSLEWKYQQQNLRRWHFLGQDRIACEIVVDIKRLQYVKTFNYLGCEISNENDRDIQQKLAKFAQILGILNIIFKLTLVQKFLRKKYTMHWLSPFFYMEVKFGHLGWGRDKK